MEARRVESGKPIVWMIYLSRFDPVHLTVVTTEGLVHNSYRNEIQKELTLNDLFAPF